MHPAVLAFKKSLAHAATKKYDVEVTYITPRGLWYDVSWKGDPEKSGGIIANIGVHLLDLLGYMFGDVQHCEVHFRDGRSAGGYFEFTRARVRWFLSLKSEDLRQNGCDKYGAFRCIKIDEEELNLSSGFEQLHSASYHEILHGRGFGLKESRLSMELMKLIHECVPEPCIENSHPLSRKEFRRDD